ncbi:33073_t:CDS:2, partial [Racocetra persica]
AMLFAPAIDDEESLTEMRKVNQQHRQGKHVVISTSELSPTYSNNSETHQKKSHSPEYDHLTEDPSTSANMSPPPSSSQPPPPEDT